MNLIMFYIVKIRLFFAICRKNAAKKTLQTAVDFSRSASENVTLYFERMLQVSLECERLAVEYKRLKSKNTEKPLLKLCLSMGEVVTSSKSEIALTKLDIETALVRHKYGDWGELTINEWKRNNRIAETGDGIIHSCYNHHGGTNICIDTCMPSGDTLLRMEGE